VQSLRAFSNLSSSAWIVAISVGESMAPNPKNENARQSCSKWAGEIQT
jgi:hypothetical protein